LVVEAAILICGTSKKKKGNRREKRRGELRSLEALVEDGEREKDFKGMGPNPKTFRGQCGSHSAAHGCH
jgi:hypothetical protein